MKTRWTARPAQGILAFWLDQRETQAGMPVLPEFFGSR